MSDRVGEDAFFKISQDLWRRLQHLGTWKGLGMDVGKIHPIGFRPGLEFCLDY